MYFRGHFTKVRKMFQFHTLEEDTAPFENEGDVRPPYEVRTLSTACRTVQQRKSIRVI